MDTKQQMEEIAFLLEAIVEQTETIGRHGGKIPQIELDLVKENIRKLYEAYHRLDKDNAGEDVGNVVVPEVRTTLQPAPRPEPPPAREDPPAPPLAAATPLTPAKTDTSPQRAPEPQRSEADLLFDEMITIRGKATEDHLPLTAEDRIPEDAPRITIPRRPSDIPLSTVPSHEADAPRLADTLRKEEKTLNDQMELPNGFSVAERLQQHRINDLRTALGINDKFLFINDLFAGDSERYNQAIEALNTMAGMNEANIHINHLQQQFGWDKESPAVVKLKEFLRRRYL